MESREEALHVLKTPELWGSQMKLWISNGCSLCLHPFSVFKQVGQNRGPALGYCLCSTSSTPTAGKLPAGSSAFLASETNTEKKREAVWCKSSVSAESMRIHWGFWVHGVIHISPEEAHESMSLADFLDNYYSDCWGILINFAFFFWSSVILEVNNVYVVPPFILWITCRLGKGSKLVRAVISRAVFFQYSL